MTASTKMAWTGNVMYLVRFTKRAAKDARKLKSAGLDVKAKNLVAVVREDPFKTPPRHEALVGNLSGMYSRRINIQHRFVYEVIPGPLIVDGVEYECAVKVLSMWPHYEGF